MGSLILAGAVKGAGEGMVANVVRENENRQRDLDREHDKALQRMHDQAAMARLSQAEKGAMDRQTQGQGFEREMYGVTREDQLEDFGVAAEAEAALAGAERAHESRENQLDRDAAFMTEAMKQFLEETNGTSVRSADGKWEMKVLTDTIEGPGGIPVEQDRFVVREPNSPLVLEQFENVMLPNGQNEEERNRALAFAKGGKLKKAEQDLLKRVGSEDDNSSEFLEAYGYLPVSYYRKVAEQKRGADGFGTFMNRFRQPTKEASDAARTATESMQPATQPAPQPEAAVPTPPLESTLSQAAALSGYDPTTRNIPVDQLSRTRQQGGF